MWINQRLEYKAGFQGDCISQGFRGGFAAVKSLGGTPAHKATQGSNGAPSREQEAF